MTSEGLLGRAATFSIAALVHLIFLSAFLGKIRVGLPVLLHPDAHPSDRATPIIAYIVSSSTNGTRTVGSSPPTLEANQLVPVSQKFDVPHRRQTGQTKTMPRARPRSQRRLPGRPAFAARSTFTKVPRDRCKLLISASARVIASGSTLCCKPSSGLRNWLSRSPMLHSPLSAPLPSAPITCRPSFSRSNSPAPRCSNIRQPHRRRDWRIRAENQLLDPKLWSYSRGT